MKPRNPLSGTGSEIPRSTESGIIWIAVGLLLAGTAWLFKDSFLAAIPLIGLCALCAFPEKLQFLRAEVSSQGAKFEMRGKK